ncbi:MAG: valine--tRNA ligase [Akkermansiaceae bacterium]|nr:valine--tRNA ligase [Akkermansiaceae bacterium]NNM28414.1 valine--tRNA ligase [Akkermansiaceae bacterium]
MAELSKAYEPGEVEAAWYARWLEGKCFHAEAGSGKPGYSIVIPPPNVTGILHMGHVLNNTIQDILCRRARQEGKEVLWLPGTDHAGIATQTKVERKLRDEGKTKRDVGREKFLEMVWDWKDHHGGIIIDQLKKLGCSCDWERERFTMDEEYSREVQRTFVHFFKQGNIYRGKRMVNWCPVSLTALSDEEVDMKPQQSKLYYMKYELVEEPGTHLRIATTRPETLMGDTGVAVNPRDERYGHLVGKHARRPFPAADIPIVADEHIDPEFGTGVLKVTPAHDKADFEIGQRHGLEILDVLHPDGRVNCPECPDLDGLDRFEARYVAAKKLEDMGLLEKTEDHENKVGFSERAGVPIEPRISMQWFLRYPQVGRATRVVADGEIEFRPPRWKKTYMNWMENIQDWCISRQLWWGHRIPVWYRKEKAVELQEAESLDAADLERGDLHVGTEPPGDPGNWVQDEDVLDTWFSSWLWPYATMDEPTRAKFYPTSDLSTGPDILFFWVARMIMAGLEFMDEVPFKNVYFHSIVRDLKGDKMSKSLGNSPDPLDLIANYGADGLRLGLMRIAPTGMDVRFDEKQIEEGRNFANKLWNACRYRLMQGEAAMGGPAAADRPAELPVYAIDILAKLDALGEQLETAYAAYKFNDIAAQLYEFFWSNFCDLYLEAVKNDFREGGERKAATLWTMDVCLSRFLQALHPFMPHVTEELWRTLGFGREGEFLMQAELPREPVLAGLDAAEARERAAAVYESASRIRNLKAEYNLASNKKVRLVVKPAGGWVEAEAATLALLTGAAAVDFDAAYEPPKGTPAALTAVGEVYLPLEGLIDVAAERSRLGKEIAKVEKEMAKSEAKLGNANFVERAKPEVVEQERGRLKDWQEKIAQLQEMLAGLG